jgi:hypothetical protein
VERLNRSGNTEYYRVKGYGMAQYLEPENSELLGGRL